VILALVYAIQYTVGRSQALVNWKGCDRKGIQCKIFWWNIGFSRCHKKTKKVIIPFLSTAGVQYTIPTKLGMVIGYHFCTPLTFVDLISSFATRGY